MGEDFNNTHILGFFFTILKISFFNFFLNVLWMNSERRIQGWSYRKPLLLGAWGPSVHDDGIIGHYDGSTM